MLKRRAVWLSIAFVILLLAGLAAWRLTSSRASAASVRWYDNLDEAHALAQQSNKPMLLDFWATWCTACQGMENDVFTNPAFKHAADSFVAARIDYDKNDELAREYKVTGLPTMVFTDSFGTEVAQQEGFLDANRLAQTMNSISPRVAEFNRLDTILAHDSTNTEALKEMADSLRDAGLFSASNVYYEKELNTKEAKFSPAEQEAILTTIGANSLEAKDGDHAAEAFEKCLKQFPNSAQSAAWILELSNAYVLAQQKERARKLLQTFVREHPHSAQSEKAKTLLASL